MWRCETCGKVSSKRPAGWLIVQVDWDPSGLNKVRKDYCSKDCLKVAFAADLSGKLLAGIPESHP